MADLNISAISVFVVVDNKVCLMPIAAESAQAFVAMGSAFQSGAQKATKLITLPESVAHHVAAAGRAIGEAIEEKGEKKC